MQVSNGTVWQAKEALQGLLKEPWPVKTAYALVKLARKIGEQYALIDQVRVGLIQQYGEPNDQGQITVPQSSAHWPAFVTAFNELMAQETEIGAERVSLPALDDISISPQVLMSLDPFVEVA